MFDFWFRLSLRVRLGVVSVVLLVIAVSLGYFAISDPVHHPMTKYSTIIKIAPIIFLIWLAWRDFLRIPLWVYLVLFPVAMLCLWKPYTLLYVIPITLIILFVAKK
ncbi:MAG: hypothetical protein LBH59_00665 [Planctomycetaceae bacterium]|nr:hypothetical protein [Planctomycetaceae bacterium]